MAAQIFQQMSYTMCSYIKMFEDTKSNNIQQYYFYLIGSGLSFLMIILISDKYYGRRKKFLPLYIWTAVQLACHIVLLVIQLILKLEDNIYESMLSGFLDNTLNFYYLFICPIMIAYSHRASQFITPIATILTLNLVVGHIFDYIFTETFVGILFLLTQNKVLLRVPSILCLVVSLSIVYP